MSGENEKKYGQMHTRDMICRPRMNFYESTKQNLIPIEFKAEEIQVNFHILYLHLK